MQINLAKLLVNLKRKVKTEISKTHFGKVVKINPQDGTVDVELLTEDITLSHVPVFIPGSPSLGLAFHVELQTIGKVTCIDVDFGNVFNRGQKEKDFKNLHGLNAIFEPGFLVKGSRPTPPEGHLQVGNNDSLIISTPSEILIGQGATQNVGLSNPIDQNFSTLRTFINATLIPAINAAAATMTGPPPIPTLQVPPLPSSAASKVKAQ